MWRGLFAIGSILTVAAGGCATATVGTEVRSYLSAYATSGLSSGVVLIARGDTVVAREAFGYADWESRVPNTTDTGFRIGSITKSMTWAAVARLADRGLLDLDDSVANSIGAPTLPAAVTVRLLMNHQGGVADWSAFADLPAFQARASSLAELAEWVASKPLIYAPGTDRQYSNSGYILLARVVEVVSGEPYGAYLSEELFGPLGMHETEHIVEPAAERLATGYGQGHRPVPAVKVRGEHPSILAGSGSVVSTAGDLFTWSRSDPAQGFPWDRRSRNGRSVRFMGGFVPGFGAWIEQYLDEDVTVIVLTNLNNGAIQKMVSDLGAIVFGAPYEPPHASDDRPVARREADAFSGAWTCDGGAAFTIRPAGDRLELLWRHRGPSQPLWAQSDTVLFYPQDWAEITVRDPGGARGLSYEASGVTAACRPQG